LVWRTVGGVERFIVACAMDHTSLWKKKGFTGEDRRRHLRPEKREVKAAAESWRSEPQSKRLTLRAMPQAAQDRQIRAPMIAPSVLSPS
jgi:hypothetical protein